MRNNFEKGLQLARGKILCCIGDDDGLLPSAVETALRLFSTMPIDALSAARAHYHWPDLQWWGKDSALVPRGTGVTVLNSRSQLRTLLLDNDYHRLPCIYQGFVKRTLIDKAIGKQARFFLSNQVDIFSSVALSMQNVSYGFSSSPLVINGSSTRSNGASHSGSGGKQEQTLWKSEDDVGFLPGFEDALSIGAVIIESALRYGQSRGIRLAEMLDLGTVERALQRECSLRRQAGRPEEGIAKLYETVGDIGSYPAQANSRRLSEIRAFHLIRKFVRLCPVLTEAKGISNVYECAMYLQELLRARRVGFFHHPLEQLKVAVRAVRP